MRSNDDKKIEITIASESCHEETMRFINGVRRRTLIDMAFNKIVGKPEAVKIPSSKTKVS